MVKIFKDKAERTWILTAMVTLFVIVILAGIIPQTIALKESGFEEANIRQQWNFYVTLAGISLVGVLALVVSSLLIKKGDNKYGNSVGFADLGGLPGFQGLKRFSVFQFVMITAIIFVLLGTIISFAPVQKTYTGVDVLPTQQQQFSEADSLKFSSSLIPAAENVAFLCVIGGIMFTLHLLARKYNWSTSFFVVMVLLSTLILGGALGYIAHLTVHPESEVAQMTSAGFWSIGGVITAITGLFFTFLIMHQVNNVLADLIANYGMQTTQIYFVITLVALITIYIILFRKRLLGKRKNTEE